MEGWVCVKSRDASLYMVMVYGVDFGEVDGVMNVGDKSTSSVCCPVFADCRVVWDVWGREFGV